MNNLPDNYKDYYANKTCHVKRQVKNVCNTTNKNDVCPSIGVYNGDNFELNIFVGYLPFNPIQGNFDFDIVVVFRDFTTDENLEFVFDSVELQEAILKFKQLYNTYFN